MDFVQREVLEYGALMYCGVPHLSNTCVYETKVKLINDVYPMQNKKQTQSLEGTLILNT